MGMGDVSQQSYKAICELFQHYLWGDTKHGKIPKDSSLCVSHSTNSNVTRAKIGNLLNKFKTDILGSLISQLDTMKIKEKQEKEDLPLVIFSSKCPKKNPLWECPLNNIETCAIYEQNHATSNCPSLIEIKECYEWVSDGVEQLCFVTQKWPRPPRQQGVTQDPSSYFSSYLNMQYPSDTWYPPIPW